MLKNHERIAQLEACKQKEYFILDHWEDREVAQSSEVVVGLMRKEVKRFIDFLIERITADSTNLQAEAQAYFDEWDNEDFNQDETEFIVEVEFEAMRIAGINIDHLLI